MKNIFKIAIRNLMRYRRRTLMTSLLIIIGIVMVVIFSGVSDSFKNMMIVTITDSMLGHAQIHRTGYVSSIENLPLHLNMNDQGIEKLEKTLKKYSGEIEAYSYCIKLSAMLSNYEETRNIRLTGLILFVLLPETSRGQEELPGNELAVEILRKANKNLMPEFLESYRKLINQEPDGSMKEYIFFTVKKGKDKMAMLYISPASERRRSTIRLGTNMWLYTVSYTHLTLPTN